MVNTQTKAPISERQPDRITDFEVQPMQDEDLSGPSNSTGNSLRYFLAGTVFGIVLVKSEVVSWFRIQEMFRLQSFHMYGVIASAVIVAMISVWVIRKFNIKTIDGEEIKFYPRKFSQGQVFGGLLFGLGWALTGACPGPLYALVGSGYGVVLITLFSAVAGTWTYGLLKPKLPN